MDQNKQILWIDDDIKSSILRPYVDEFFDNGYSILKVKNPDDIEENLKDPQGIIAIIIDVSMPTGETVDFHKAKGGLHTGFIVLKRLLDKEELNHAKKIVFTIVEDSEIMNFCKEVGIPYLKKNDYVSDTFEKKIEDLLKV